MRRIFEQSTLNRRQLLASGAVLATAAATPALYAKSARGTPDATGLAELVARNEVTPRELVEAAITRIERLNPRLNAIITPLFEQARQTVPAAGPFRGVPYVLKDFVDLAGTRRTSGSRVLAHNISAETTPIVARTIAAGFTIVAKTNMPELALSATTEPVLFGPTRNPWDPTRSAGGSSGGSAAAVAAGIVPLAHASDGGGSIRIPASCCGLFGLKPSRGRMIGSQLTDSGVEHCVSRSVRDSARLFEWTQRSDEGAPLTAIQVPSSPSKRRLKIAFATASIRGQEPEPAVKACIEATARLCAALGHHVELARLPIEGDTFFDHFMTAWSRGAARAVELVGTQKPEDLLEPWTLYLAEHAHSLPETAMADAHAYFAVVTQRMATFFERYDVLLTPVTNAEPPEIGVLSPTQPGRVLWERLIAYAAYTPLHNVAGTPAMSIPLGRSPSGLPIGSQFAARIGDERTLFELAFELEQARPFRLM